METDLENNALGAIDWYNLKPGHVSIKDFSPVPSPNTIITAVSSGPVIHFLVQTKLAEKYC